jgi:hypothetical protein
MLNQSEPFGLSLSNPLILQAIPFDKLRANGFAQRFPNSSASTATSRAAGNSLASGAP